MYSPQFTITPHLLKIIEEISSLRERIVSATVQVPWVPMLQREARLRNTHGSTAIEGNPLTLEEVVLLEEGKEVSFASDRSKQEILNALAGLRFVEKNGNKKEITKQDILRLHSIMAKGVMDQGEPGAYRSMGVRVGSHIAPPPHEVPGMMKDLLSWWNKKSHQWTPVISSSVLHYRFEEIHPFADGNGRVGRAIALWELYRRGFDTQHIFSIDEIIWEHQQNYYKAFELVRSAHGNLTSWLEFIAECIHLALERAWDRTQKLLAQHGVQKISLSQKQERLLNMLREFGPMTPAQIWKFLNITKQGALNLLNPLLEAGLIERVGTRKSGKYQLPR